MKAPRYLYAELMVLGFTIAGIWLIATDIPWLAGLVAVVFGLAVGHGYTERKKAEAKAKRKVAKVEPTVGGSA